jgi:hypothetical protein
MPQHVIGSRRDGSEASVENKADRTIKRTELAFEFLAARMPAAM